MLIIINVNCQLMLIIMRIAKQVAHCATLKKVAAIVAETIAATCLAIILAVARHVTLCNGSCNFSPNDVARQVTRKLAQCNTASSVI